MEVQAQPYTQIHKPRYRSVNIEGHESGIDLFRWRGFVKGDYDLEQK